MRRGVFALGILVAVGCSAGANETTGSDEFAVALTEVLATSDVEAKRRGLERATEAARAGRIRARDCVLVEGLGEDAVDYDETTADSAIVLYDAVEGCSAECREGLMDAYNGDWFAHSMLVRAAALRTILYRHPDDPQALAEGGTKDRDSLVRAAAYQWLLANDTGDAWLRWAQEANADPSAHVREIAPVLTYPDAGPEEE